MNDILLNVECIDEYTGDKNICKNFLNTYLYHKSSTENDKLIFEYLMKCHRVDKSNESFNDIRFELKRRSVMNKITNALDSNKVVLAIYTQLPRAFRVFYGKDVKDKKPKVFIDCSSIMSFSNDKYILPSKNIDILVSYLTAATNELIYYQDPNRLLTRISTIDKGARCFSDLVSYIIDFLRLSSIDGLREKTKYLSTKYYLTNILGKENNDSTEKKALQISGLSERQVEIINLELSDNWNLNIKTFIDNLAKIFRIENKLTLDVFIDKWMYLYGAGTHYATELYTSFANMMIYAYVGAYINNQKTIEKVCGNNMVEFVKGILEVGENAL